MACDMCGKSEPTTSLNSQYCTKYIKELCSSCEKKVSDHLWHIREMQMKILHGSVKGLMINYRDKYFAKNTENKGEPNV